MLCEAWSSKESDEPAPGALTFRIRPHENGRDWRVVEGGLQHPLWTKKLGDGISHILMRGAGYLCRIEVLNGAGDVSWLVVVDQRGNDPYARTGATLKQV